MPARFPTDARIPVLALALSRPGWAQFSSNSTGSDGALDFSNMPPGTTVVFNPKSYNPPLNPVGDNIFNFTTITIPQGVTVRLDGSIFTQPVVFLASGPVQINGTIDLSGGTGGCSSPANCRTQSIPGAGGYPGGIAGNGNNNPPTAGLGPGGGAAQTSSSNAVKGTYTGNAVAVPLIGGSGGGGSFSGGGGAGGGAILIASSASINFGPSTNLINASGGAGSGGGGSGAGGAIRLMAPSISVPDPNCSCFYDAFPASVVRVETFSLSGVPNGNTGAGGFSVAVPFSTFVTSNIQPSIGVLSVNGVLVNQPPSGSFQMPDVTINSIGPVTIALKATQVPTGTVVSLHFVSDNGSDVTTSAIFGGTLAQSTASTTVTFPSGFSRGFVTASFSQ
jgi:hypothetical protein